MRNKSKILNSTNLAVFQGIFYLLTGLWPILNIDSFMAVTGPKTDIWLVRTVGMLIFFIGAGLLTAGLKKQMNFSLMMIAAGAALGFILVDIIYVSSDVISPVYLLDAVAEFFMFILWMIIYRREFAKSDRLDK